MRIRLPVRIALLVAACSVFQSGSATAASVITFARARECARCVGDFANVIPVLQFGIVGLQQFGVLPDEEKEFRDGMEKRNKQILQGITRLNDGVKRIESALDDIQAELAGIRKDVKSLPERVRSGELYVKSYTVLKRGMRLENPTAADVAALRKQLQDLLDEADGVSTVDSADLLFCSACSLICITMTRCCEIDVMLAGKDGIQAEQKKFYRRSAESMEQLLAHCESIDVLARRKDLQDDHAASVKRLRSATSELGFVWADQQDGPPTVLVGLKSTEKREVKSEGFRVVLIRTEKKYETIVTEAGYSLTDAVSESVPSARDSSRELLSLFRPLEAADFKTLTDAEVNQHKSDGTLVFAKVDTASAIPGGLKAAIDAYNDSAAECRQLAFQVILADGLTKWLAENRQLVSRLESAARE